MSGEAYDDDAVDLEQVFGFAQVEDDLGMAEYLAAVYSDVEGDRDRSVASARRLVYMRQRLDGMISAHSAWRSTGKISENTLRNLEDDIGVAEAQWIRGPMPGESVRLDTPTRTPALSAEEAAYLLALSQGDKPAEIARRRGFTSARPVQIVIQAARKKLGCKTTEQAVLWAYPEWRVRLLARGAKAAADAEPFEAGDRARPGANSDREGAAPHAPRRRLQEARASRQRRRESVSPPD